MSSSRQGLSLTASMNGFHWTNQLWIPWSELLKINDYWQNEFGMKVSGGNLVFSILPRSLIFTIFAPCLKEVKPSSSWNKYQWTNQPWVAILWQSELVRERVVCVGLKEGDWTDLHDDTLATVLADPSILLMVAFNDPHTHTIYIYTTQKRLRVT